MEFCHPTPDLAHLAPGMPPHPAVLSALQRPVAPLTSEGFADPLMSWTCSGPRVELGHNARMLYCVLLLICSPLRKNLPFYFLFKTLEPQHLAQGLTRGDTGAEASPSSPWVVASL